MSDRIYRIDLHSEVTPPGATVIVPQLVNSEVQATQTLVKVNGEPLLRVGDRFRCEHMPKVGAFAQPLPAGTGEGSLARAGQSLLKINGELAVSQDGTNRSCSEGVQEMSNRATTLLGGRPLLKVNQAVILLGR